jgi:hypothetical protein
MPNEDVDMGLKCVLKNVRWPETWFTVFPLYLHGNGTAEKGFKSYLEVYQKPYERLITTFVHNLDFKYHWVVTGVKGLAKESGLYRAGDCNYPYTPLEFDFPLCAVDPGPPFAAEPFAQEVDTYDYCYLKIRAIVPSVESIVCLSFYHPAWLATNLGNDCCIYDTESATVKTVRYTLTGNPAQLNIAAFLSASPVQWDCGPLPPEYDGKRNPNVRWIEYDSGIHHELSHDPNNPTVLTIDLTAGIDP